MNKSRLLLALCLTLFLLALAVLALELRLVDLAARPMHCDEATQARKAGDLLTTGVYKYDPHEYHGPSLCFFTLPSLWMNGVHTFGESEETAYRIVPVLFGVGLILLLLLVADGLGPGATVLAGVFTAISPAMVYYSRYYIQETLLVFFTFAAIGCTWRAIRGRSLAWLVPAGAAFGMMHATKETWVFAAAAMIAGVILSVAWRRLGKGTRPVVGSWAGWYLWPWPMLEAALVVAVVFYSSFGRDWSGPGQSIMAYVNYYQRGSQGGESGIHVHPWYFFLQLLTYNRSPGFFWSEGLIVGLALVGILAALIGRGLPEPQKAFGRFLAFYTPVLTALYAVIPYKTPWCLLSFLHAMILLAGIGVWALLRWTPTWPLKVLLGLVLAVVAGPLSWQCYLDYLDWLCCQLNLRPIAQNVSGMVPMPLGWQCYQLNFRFAADPRNPYVYAHTTPDTFKLTEFIGRLAGVSPQGNDLVIYIVADNYWPLPWYLRRYPHVGYWQEVKDWTTDAASLPRPSIVLLPPSADEDDPERDADTEKKRADLLVGYRQLGSYGLRPGVLLQIAIREDLYDRFVASQE